MQEQSRLYFLDWSRVIAFFLLILFHCALPFADHRWEINNAAASPGITRLVWWMHQWRLPLLFFIAGAGIRYSLAKRSVLAFAGERILRLFLPLLFAMFFTIPLQVYYEWLQDGKISGSYAAFYPSVWNMVPYPEGTLTWSHMWFVVYLFVYILLLLPVFGVFKIRILEQWKSKAAGWLSHPLGLLLFLLPLFYYYHAFYIRYPEQGSLLDDWFIFLFYITLLLYGYFLSSNTLFWERCERYRFYFLGIALICIAVLYYYYWWDSRFPREQNMDLYRYALLNSLHIWCWVLAMLGLARRHLNFTTPRLQYLTAAVYPYYILHQTVIVALGYYIVQWPAGIGIKLFFLVILSLSIIAALYHWLIRPFVLTRFLFGVKRKKRR